MLIISNLVASCTLYAILCKPAINIFNISFSLFFLYYVGIKIKALKCIVYIFLSTFAMKLFSLKILEKYSLIRNKNQFQSDFNLNLTQYSKKNACTHEFHL